MRRSVPFAVILLVAVGIAGCDRPNEVSVVPVTGKVLLDGEPLKFGSVTLQPSHGQPARGDIGHNGEFKLSTYRPGDGAAIGRHKVKVTCYTSQDPAAKMDKAASVNQSLGPSLIPDRYTRFDSSGLGISILSSGDKPYVIELTSDSQEDVAATEEPVDEAESQEEQSATQGPAQTAPELQSPSTDNSASPDAAAISSEAGS